MNPSQMMKPRPIEGEPQKPAMPMADDAGYTGSDQRCASCAHFDGDSKCEIGVNGGVCEPMGHCNKFEGGGEEDGEGMREAEGSEDAEAQG